MEAITFSKSIEYALIRGVANFNEASSRCEVKPRYYKDGSGVREFYSDLIKAIDDSKQGGDEAIGEFCHDFVRRMKRKQGDKTISTIIFGIYIYSPYKQSYVMTLIYYDFSSDTNSDVTRVVTATPGRTQDSELESMMESLLQKVYD